MKLKAVLFLVVTFYFTSLSAAPAPWYQWQSKVDGKVFCAQTSPGKGWKRLKGSYQDVRCEKPDLNQPKKKADVIIVEPVKNW